MSFGGLDPTANLSSERQSVNNPKLIPRFGDTAPLALRRPEIGHGSSVVHGRSYAPIGCDTQRAFMKWSRTSYDSKKEHSRTGENEKGIQNPQV